MPLLHIHTSGAPRSDSDRNRFLSTLASTLATLIGKPERYVMVAISPQPEIFFAGTRDPACYAELKNVGTLTEKQVLALSETLCTALAEFFNIAKDRIYIEFTNADGALWGYNGGTFG